MKCRGLKIFIVEPGSIADELGLEAGDRLTAINGEPVRDIIDFRYLAADDLLCVDIKKTDGEEWVLEVEKDFDQDLGIDFGADCFGPTTRCANKCVFCFVDQMPPGMRTTLYVKDDDYRLSFWSGNFITLTNLSKNKLKRIAGQRLSPLYISVHTTNPDLREKMLGSSRAGSIMDQLRFLAEAGIEMHTQVVLCPGLNDNGELERTAGDLASLWPAVRSLAVVPVGLTRFRESLYHLDVFTPEKARRLVRWIHARQKEYMTSFKHHFIFASDEFYLLAGEPIPGADRYDGFPQIENGVGLTRLFKDEWAEAEDCLPDQAAKQKIVLVTGVLGEAILKPVAARLNKIAGLQVLINVVKNEYFGRQVTATGLVTGIDILTQVAAGDAGGLLVIPSVMLKNDEAVFLDNVSVEELSERLKVRVAVVSGPRQLVDVIINGPEKAEMFIDKRS
jgi:putative radical SAM enzyme (TIGR03279 family)